MVRGATTVASKGNVGTLGRVPLTGKHTLRREPSEGFAPRRPPDNPPSSASSSTQCNSTAHALAARSRIVWTMRTPSSLLEPNPHAHEHPPVTGEDVDCGLYRRVGRNARTQQQLRSYNNSNNGPGGKDNLSFRELKTEWEASRMQVRITLRSSTCPRRARAFEFFGPFQCPRWEASGEACDSRGRGEGRTRT